MPHALRAGGSKQRVTVKRTFEMGAEVPQVVQTILGETLAVVEGEHAARVAAAEGAVDSLVIEAHHVARLGFYGVAGDVFAGSAPLLLHHAQGSHLP